MINLKSDNTSGVHRRLFDAMSEEVANYRTPYGEDEISHEARELIAKTVGADKSGVFFVTTGTAANIIGMASMLRPFESVVCCDTAHVNIEETGGFERFTGSKLLLVPNYDGKLKIADIERVINANTTYHETVPKVVSISNLTEFGTIYTPSEIKEIADFVHGKGMYLHMDGTRIANAIVGANTTPMEMYKNSGVDIASFGGTKNGMMFGEAIVCFREELIYPLTYLIKQGFQLLSKMRFIAAQFIPYIKENIYYENAKNASDMMQLLYNGIKDLPEVKLVYPVEANMLFMEYDESIVKKLEGKVIFDNFLGDIRLVTSFSTTKEDIEKVIEVFNS